jgi:hypothetical protein
MNVAMIMREQAVDSLQSDVLDGLIAGHFDRAFLFFNMFVDDPRNCLDLSEAVFRTLNGRGAATEHDFYREVVDCVRALPERNEIVPGIPSDSVLCWLLKDSAALAYHEIGTVMAMEREQVQQRIADVRMALLG